MAAQGRRALSARGIRLGVILAEVVQGVYARFAASPCKSIAKHRRLPDPRAAAASFGWRVFPRWAGLAAIRDADPCAALLEPDTASRRPHRAEPASERLERGIWCGPVSNHFGHMVADFAMRIAASSRLDPVTPLVFSIDPEAPEPLPVFWQIPDHL